MVFENQILHPGEKIKKLRINADIAVTTKRTSSKSISSAIENKREALSVNAPAKVIAI